MRKSYHICVSGGDEVIFRSDADYYHAFNCLALACHESESSLLAESIMSTHSHTCARTEVPELLVNKFRYAYARYFNNKYKRLGRLGEKINFITELDGLYHHLSAISYTLRNSVHHGIAQTPFAYPHSSACALFRKELGREETPIILPEKSCRKYLPSRAEWPANYKMSEAGVFLRESVIDVVDVEHMFGSPRAYLYYMNRLSGEEWTREQDKDGVGVVPFTLEKMELGVGMHSLDIMLSNEKGRFDPHAMTDIKLCELIDNEILMRYGRESVYELDRCAKEALGNYLCRTYHLSREQVSRCIAYKY